MSVILLDEDFNRGLGEAPPPVRLTAEPPALGYLGLRLYSGMAPNWLAADPKNDYAMAWFIYSFTYKIEPIIALFRDSAAGPGWSALLDIERCPADWLDWLAQFMGVAPATEISPPLDDASQRERIERAEGFWRGTVGDLVTKVRRHLTGTRRVEIYQYYRGDAFQVRIVTFDAETPDPDVTLTDMLPEPAGFRFTYEVFPGQDYAELLDRYPTYADVRTAFRTYEDVRRNIPTGP